MVKELKNFLPKKQFLEIKQFLESDWMPWFYNKTQTDIKNVKKDDSFFSHRFFYDNEKTSNLYDLIYPLIKKLNPNILLRVKANLTINRGSRVQSNFHTDQDCKHKVAIYYINKCNGYTLIGKNKKIKCEENKMLIFDGNLLHCAVSQTNKDQRIVININYE